MRHAFRWETLLRFGHFPWHSIDAMIKLCCSICCQQMIIKNHSNDNSNSNNNKLHMKMWRKPECDYITTLTQPQSSCIAIDFFLRASSTNNQLKMNEEGAIKAYTQNKHLKREATHWTTKITYGSLTRIHRRWDEVGYIIRNICDYNCLCRCRCCYRCDCCCDLFKFIDFRELVKRASGSLDGIDTQHIDAHSVTEQLQFCSLIITRS